MTNQRFDLEERTLLFAKRVQILVSRLSKSPANTENSRQLIRSAGSVGANYIEANDALGPKDFLMRIKISRKEAKEAQYWLRLLETEESSELQTMRDSLVQEAYELRLILSAIIKKIQLKKSSNAQ